MEKNEEYKVYFIAQSRPRGVEPIKIGFSKDPEKRLSVLQTANCDKLKLAASIICGSKSDAMKLERTLHFLASKKHQRLSGEWFIVRGSFKKLIAESIKLCRIDLPEQKSKLLNKREAA